MVHFITFSVLGPHRSRSIDHAAVAPRQHAPPLLLEALFAGRYITVTSSLHYRYIAVTPLLFKTLFADRFTYHGCTHDGCTYCSQAGCGFHGRPTLPLQYRYSTVTLPLQADCGFHGRPTLPLHYRYMRAATSTAGPPPRSGSTYHRPTVSQHGQGAILAVPEIGSFASSGRAWLLS